MRFIIEKINGHIKNNKALDNIRNSRAGHILIDYRIACAILNFLHKPCCPDGEQASIIANKMKKKADSKIIKNYLDSLLKIRFNTKMVPPQSLSIINDFPKLKKKQLVMGLLWGTFQLRLCKSYLSDLLKSHVVFEIPKKNIEHQKSAKLRDLKTKIIGVEISSRHKRGLTTQNVSKDKSPTFRTKYRVLIHYCPNLNNIQSIKSKLFLFFC